MMFRFACLALVAGFGAASTGCGGGNTTDAAGASSAITSLFTTTGGLGLKLKEFENKVNDRILVEKLRAEALVAGRRNLAPAEAFDCTTVEDVTCTEGSSTVEGEGTTSVSCDVTCEGSTTTTACTLDEAMTVACGATTYSLTGGTFTATVPAPTCDSTETSVTIGVTVNLDFSVTVSGGEIAEAATLACNFANTFSFTFDQTAGTASATFGVADCAGFTCTLGGETLSCEDMQAAMAENTCTTSAT